MSAPATPSTPSTSANPACPCGSGRPLAACCGRWHAGAQALQAPDAEALMRSRYSAYVLGLTGYLRDTWHPDTRPAELALEPGLRWLGLQVRRHQPGADGNSAVVEFVARSKLGGRAHRLHETSRFVRATLPGAMPADAPPRWWYVDGDLHA